MDVKEHIRKRRQEQIKRLENRRFSSGSAEPVELALPAELAKPANPANPADPFTPPTIPSSWRSTLRIKLIISFILFVAVWGLFQFHHPLASTGQMWVKRTMNEDFDFKSVAAWYSHQFSGIPSLIPALNIEEDQATRKVNAHLAKGYYPPVLGQVKTDFTSTKRGIEIETRALAPIVALDAGRVIYVGKRIDSGFTVMIQHPNDVQSIYGNIAVCIVKENEWVKGGQQIATVGHKPDAQQGMVYFAVKHGDDYIDPLDVINFE